MLRILTDMIVTGGANLGLQALLERACSIIDEAYEPYGITHGAALYVWDPEIERLVARAATHAPRRAGDARTPIKELSDIQLRLGQGITGWAAERRETVVVGDIWGDPRWFDVPAFDEAPYKSTVVAPILSAEQELIGAISVVTKVGDYFTDEHVRVVEQLSPLLAVAITRIARDEELARRAKVLSFLGEWCGRLVSPRPVGELLDSVAALTNEVTASETCLVVVYDRAEGRFVLRGMAPARAEVIAGIADRLGALPDVDTAGHDHLFRELALALPERYAEAASAPLLAGAEHLGFLSCYRHRRYSAADRDLLAVIAGQLALGLVTLGQRDAPGERDDAAQLLGLLASGRDRATATSIAGSLGLDLARPHVLVQGRFSPLDSRTAPGEIADRFARAAKFLVREVEAGNPRSLIRESAGGVVGLIALGSLSGGPALQRRLQASADAIAERWGVTLSLGLSTPCRGPGEYADAHREAAEALEVGSGLRGEGQAVRFEELGPDLYLFRMADDPRTRRDPWVRALSPVVDYDRTRRSALLATLDAYLAGRGNAALTAEQLGVHRNTLRQRLAKVEELTGIVLAETHDWLPLHFAVKLARMRERDQ